MCGIAGIWSPDPLVHAALPRALDRMRHRGPDDQASARVGQVSLGMCRLSIIDVEGGKQPLWNESRDVGVVCNGEIYNFVELRGELERRGHVFRTRSDVEVLPHLYEDDGASCVRRLLGMWGFALVDAPNRRLLLSRDRLGKKPLLYVRRPDMFLFASEAKALRVLCEAAGVSLTVSAQAIYDYLSLGYVPQPETIYHEMSAVPAGANLVLDEERLVVEPYWSVPLEPAADVPRDGVEAAQRFRELLGDATRLRLRSDVPVGIFLSGGVDSSIVAVEAARRSQAVQAFTVSMPDRRVDETERARAVAARLGLRQTLLPLEIAPERDLGHMVQQCDQPFYDSSFLATHAISRLARQSVKVVLNGDGGDEVLTGYRQHYAAFLATRFPRASRLAAVVARIGAPGTGTRKSHAGFAAKFAAGFQDGTGHQFLAWSRDLLFEADKRRVWSGAAPARATEDLIARTFAADWDPLTRVTRGAFSWNLTNDFLVKMDLASMAASIEARSPLLDHRIVEFAAALPPSIRFAGMRRKALAHAAYRRELPLSVFGRKQGFEVPLRLWLRTSLGPLVRDALGDRHAAVRSYLRGEFIDAVAADPTGATRNAENVTFALLVLELWLRAQARQEA